MSAAAPKRGKLKIFFGAFPGAGKTNAMLNAARRMREAGVDVVAAVVDAHESADLVLLKGFELLPSATQGELDLDAALHRRPGVILVDDLAHSNPPGSRHPKRWNDADELLASGIDVFTTMSVQHLESLNDVVGGITGIREPETVPDTFFDTADETIMVDMSADELLVRLGEGKVHVGEVERGVEGTYFSKGSLLALREIALRRTADVVEDEVRKMRADKEGVWQTQGSLLCCIGPSPGSEHVVRSASRLAKGLAVPWTAIYVETPRLQRLPAPDRGRILNVVKLAEELGANTAIVTGNDRCQAIVDYAREHNIGRIVVGRGRVRRVFIGRAMSERVANADPTLDVIEIGRAGTQTGVAVAAPAPRPADVQGSRVAEKRIRYVWTLLACATATAISSAIYPSFELATIAMFYTLTVVLLAVKWGRGPAIIGAVINVAAFKFFFVAPRFTFVPADIQYFLTFAVMLVTGVLIGQLAGSLRFQARVAAHRERRARTLYEFARDLAQLRTPSEVIETTEDFMSRQFKARVAVLVPDSTGTLTSPTARGMTNPFDSTAAQWAFDQAQSAGAGTDTLAGNEYLFLPLKSPTRTRGVLAVRPERTRDLFIPEQRHQYEIFATLVATALERVHYVDVARDALLMAGLQSGQMRLELERCKPAELVSRALQTLGTVLGRHDVRIHVSDELPAVNVDPDLATRVLTSLMGNVARHTPAATQMTVSASAARGMVEFTVDDNGPGLPTGREEELFESFARGDTRRARRSAGLGLAISRAIVQAHGGTIGAVPREERGTRIVFTLPVAP